MLTLNDCIMSSLLIQILQSLSVDLIWMKINIRSNICICMKLIDLNSYNMLTLNDCITYSLLVQILESISVDLICMKINIRSNIRMKLIC